jgi:hypothetical protein
VTDPDESTRQEFASRKAHPDAVAVDTFDARSILCRTPDAQSLPNGATLLTIKSALLCALTLQREIVRTEQFNSLRDYTHISALDPRGRSDCVLKALLVTEAMLSMSESPRSPTMSLSGLKCPFLGLCNL